MFHVHVLLCILSVCCVVFFKCVQVCCCSLSVFKCVVVMFVIWHGPVCSSATGYQVSEGGVSVIIKVLLLSL